MSVRSPGGQPMIIVREEYRLDRFISRYVRMLPRRKITYAEMLQRFLTDPAVDEITRSADSLLNTADELIRNRLRRFFLLMLPFFRNQVTSGKLT